MQLFRSHVCIVFDLRSVASKRFRRDIPRFILARVHCCRDFPPDRTSSTAQGVMSRAFLPRCPGQRACFSARRSGGGVDEEKRVRMRTHSGRPC